VNSHQEIREALHREPGDVRAAFEELKKALNRVSQEFLSDLRNTFGGHLDEPTIHEALNVLDPLQDSTIELSKTLGETHYRFALDVIWSAVLRDVAPSAYVAQTEEILRRSAALIPAVKAIDDVLMCTSEHEVLLVHRGKRSF
jgi:hypothetical protein